MEYDLYMCCCCGQIIHSLTMKGRNLWSPVDVGTDFSTMQTYPMQHLVLSNVLLVRLGHCVAEGVHFQSLYQGIGHSPVVLQMCTNVRTRTSAQEDLSVALKATFQNTQEGSVTTVLMVSLRSWDPATVACE